MTEKVLKNFICLCIGCTLLNPRWWEFFFQQFRASKEDFNYLVEGQFSWKQQKGTLQWQGEAALPLSF